MAEIPFSFIPQNNKTQRRPGAGRDDVPFVSVACGQQFPHSSYAGMMSYLLAAMPCGKA
jgi:hypothetical protein